MGQVAPPERRWELFAIERGRMTVPWVFEGGLWLARGWFREGPHSDVSYGVRLVAVRVQEPTENPWHWLWFTADGTGGNGLSPTAETARRACERDAYMMLRSR